MRRSFDYQIIYPPKGVSGILEVSYNGDDILHVYFVETGDLKLKFFPGDLIAFSEEEVLYLLEFARKIWRLQITLIWNSVSILN